MTSSDAAAMAECYRDYENRVPEVVLAQIQSSSDNVLEMEQKLQEWVVTQPQVEE